MEAEGRGQAAAQEELIPGAGERGRRLRTIVPAWDQAPGGPLAGPRHVLRREWFGALVYDRETCQYVPYDEEAAGLLLARAPGHSGLRPGEEPSGGTAPTAAEAGFLAAMAEEGLLDERGRLAARVVADRSHPARLSAPLTVYLGATEGCNLACSHCQASSGPGPLGAFPPALLRRLCEEMVELGCGLLSISGGEPLLHPELLASLERGFELGLNVMLTTNGTLIDADLAAALAARPFRCISVSIDGPDADSHDAIRGPGALRRALDGLSRLAALRPVGVTVTLTPLLQGRLPELVRMCREAGAASISLRPALPAGRARDAAALLPSQEQFRSAIAELDRLQEECELPLFHPPEVPHQHTSAFILERFGCVAGNLVCSVGPAGQVNPCALLGPEFDAGSLQAASLHALWSEGESFRRLRALEGNPLCWSCRHYDHCGGGCRARALAAGEDLNGPDPWCSYEPLDPRVRSGA